MIKYLINLHVYSNIHDNRIMFKDVQRYFISIKIIFLCKRSMISVKHTSYTSYFLYEHIIISQQVREESPSQTDF